MAILSKNLQKKIKRITKKIDSLADALDRNIDKYQEQYERELLLLDFDIEKGRFKKNQRNFIRANSLNMARRLNWNEIVQNHIKNYEDLPLFQKDFYEGIGVDVESVNYTDLTVVKQFKSIDQEGLLTEGQNLDNIVRKELVNAIALNQDYKTTIQNISKSLLGSGEKSGRLARYSKTYIRTSMLGLSRLVDQEINERLGVKDEYVYAGTIDKKIRPFCRSHVGKTYTRAEIEKFPLQNGSGLNAFFSPGGWNCRHRLIATDLT